jgi:NADH:ubiquinone oxidoreductase subunit 6 (subunit J)
MKALTWLQPTGITLLIALILTTVHIYINYKFRLKNSVKKISWIVILGGLIVPYAMMFVYLESNQILEKWYGEKANLEHGYYIFRLYYLPFFMVGYLILMLVIDYIMKRKLIKK